MDELGTLTMSVEELTLSCADGSWFRVAPADGSVIYSGNNGLDMYGIKIAPEPRTS